MRIHTVSGDPAPWAIGLSGLDEILQNVKVILASLGGDVALDRRFAWAADMVDQPSPHFVERSFSRIVEAVEKYEPRVKVKNIRFAPQADTATADGRLAPVVDIEVLDDADV